MSKCYVIGVDGSDGSHSALEYALDNAQNTGASIKVIHVLEWSPYSFLTPEELEERHKRRGEELNRAQSAIIQPILDSLGDRAKEVETEVADIARQSSGFMPHLNLGQVAQHGGGAAGRDKLQFQVLHLTGTIQQFYRKRLAHVALKP